jgi:hypothetical protein
MTPSVCDICAEPIPVGERRCEECQAELSEQLARMMGEAPDPTPEPPTPKPVYIPLRKVSDDEILEWWEAFDGGLSVQQIAIRWRRPIRQVRSELKDLGAFEHLTRYMLEKEAAGDGDELIDRIVAGALTDEEGAIAAALARINAPDEIPYHGSVRFARSMQHVKPGARGPVVQSARQRRLDKVSPVWRRVIRADLKRAGLLP